MKGRTHQMSICSTSAAGSSTSLQKHKQQVHCERASNKADAAGETNRRQRDNRVLQSETFVPHRVKRLGLHGCRLDVLGRYEFVRVVHVGHAAARRNIRTAVAAFALLLLLILLFLRVALQFLADSVAQFPHRTFVALVLDAREGKADGL